MFCTKPFRPNRLAQALSLVFAVSAAASVHAGSGTWTTTGPYGGFVTAVAVNDAAANTAWAIGQGGVFRTYNSGTSWQRIEIGLPESAGIVDLAAATGGTVVFVASSNRVYRSGNGGDLWIPTSLPAGLGSNAIRHIAVRQGSTTSLALLTDHAVYVSTDGGSTWSGAGGLAASVTYLSLDYASDGAVYVGIQDDSLNVYGGVDVLKSINAGASWTPTGGTTLGYIAEVRAARSDPLRLFATDGGGLVTSANGGTSWTAVTLVPPSCSVTNFSIHPTIAKSVFVSCYTTGIGISADATIASPVWTTVGQANGLTANGTDSAQVASIGVPANYASSGVLYAGSTFGGLFLTSNSGTNWSEIDNGFQSVDIRSIATHPFDANVILAGAADSFSTAKSLYRSSDSGGTWPVSINGLNAEQIRSIKIDPTTVDNNIATAEPFTVYAVGRSERIPGNAAKDGGIYKSTNGGASWTTIDSGIGLYPPTGPSARPDMSTVRGIYLDPRSCDGRASTAAVCPTGSPTALQKLIVTGGGRVYPYAPGAAYTSARIYRSSNAGATWTASETGLPGTQDLGPPEASPNLAIGGVVPIVADPTNSQILYIGTFVSYDNTLPGEAESTVENGVFKSIDGGVTWVHSSNGLPRVGGPTSSQWDVLSLAINPVTPSTLYASAANLFVSPVVGRVYKSIDSGANWTNVSTGIAGQDVRALFIDPNDASGNTIYAGTGGSGADPGGVFKSTNGGTTWNSISLGMPADAATALAMPPRAIGTPARILAGTNSGVWDYTATPDDDADGAPNAVENLVGDGNGDGTADSSQANVASLLATASNAANRTANSADHVTGSNIAATIDIISGCTQLNNSVDQQAELYPPDPVGTATSHDPYGLVSFSLPHCSNAVVNVKFAGASFGAGWTWRNYGPRTPGDDASFGWYTFSGAKRLDATTWQLTLDASRQGNYRDDPNNILVVGGPGNVPDLIFDNGLQ
jgi:hypothetical protein